MSKPINCSCQENCSSCKNCQKKYNQNDDTISVLKEEKKIIGLSLGIIIIFIIINLIFFVGFIIWSNHVMKKCDGQPTWLNPTIIILLVLLFIPTPIWPAAFISLLVILMIFSYQCPRSGKRQIRMTAPAY